MKKILFLGHDIKKTKLIEEIKFYKKNLSIKQTKKKVNLKILKKFDTIISFGYRHIIDKKIIKKHERMCNEKHCVSVLRVYFYASGLYHKNSFYCIVFAINPIQNITQQMKK